MFLRSLLVVTMVGFASPVMADCYPDEGCWGAVAESLWRDYNGSANAAIGSSINQESEEVARTRAIYQCELNSEGNSCEVVGTFSHGECGYITTGRNNKGVISVADSDEYEAYDRCEAQGYDCDWPIGGCTAAEEGD